ncbi:MAG TPA: hypothetical protein VLG92_00555 [Candidatus Saccharimonadia bacterium]|nr:hypothetical protein [Candidatus Saccharimonadia bacterium]
MTIAGESILPPQDQHAPEMLLLHYDTLAPVFESELRTRDSGLLEVVRLTVPEFDPSVFTEDETGRAELLVAAGEAIGGKANGEPRWRILDREDRPEITRAQSAYIKAVATYMGSRFPRGEEDGLVSDEPQEFYLSNVHLHGEFVAMPAAGKVVIVEAAANKQAKVRRELAEKITDGNLIQTVSDRPIPLLETKTNKKTHETTIRISPEYKQVADMLGWTLPDVDADGTVLGAVLDAKGQPVSYELTEYEVTRGYNLSRGDTLLREGVTPGMNEAIQRFAEFVSQDGRLISLVQPKASDGVRASLIDGVRLALALPGFKATPGLQVGITTNGQYVAYKELGMAEVLANDFPHVAGLHMIGDETGDKRDAQTHLNEIGRFLRILGRRLQGSVTA